LYVSALTNRFVKDAAEIVKVKVREVDLQRKRIALTMRLFDETARPGKPQPLLSGQNRTKQ
jgi:uncharacterized protein